MYVYIHTTLRQSATQRPARLGICLDVIARTSKVALDTVEGRTRWVRSLYIHIIYAFNIHYFCMSIVDIYIYTRK